MDTGTEKEEAENTSPVGDSAKSVEENRDEQESSSSLERGLFREDTGAHPTKQRRDKKKKEPNHSLLQVIRVWTDGTSVHGVHYAFDPDYYPWKHIAWSVILTAMTTIMIVATLALVSQYLKYETKSSSKVTSLAQLPFPEVTVCNANPFQRSLKQKYNITWPRNEAEVNRISQSLENFMLETQFNNYSYFRRALESTRHDTVSANLKSDWRSVITPAGRCWSFLTDKTVSVPGKNGGLSFIVDLQQYEYTRDAVTAGIILYVAQPGTQIVEQMTLEAASPGGVVAVTFNANDIQLETRKPWSYCHGEAPEYTQSLCREECSNRAKAQACGCRPMGDVQPELKKLDYCGPADELCTQNQTLYDDCNCTKPSCREIQFPMRSTSAQMSRRFQRSVESYLNVTENYMAENIVFVTLNYESMIQQTVEETRVQSPYELMAAIGGVTGLYMGVSLVSIIEVFGELLGLRLLPRLWGDDRLYGIGGRS